MTSFDVDAMLERFRERAQAVRERPLPPVAGAERRLFIEQAEIDHVDFSMIGGARWEVEDQELVLRVPLSG